MRLIAPLALSLALIGCAEEPEDTGPAYDIYDRDGDGIPVNEDCDDNNAAVWGASTWYGDADGDGYAGDRLVVQACVQPEYFWPVADDCDDSNPHVYPAADEDCDGVDNDCNGATDDEDADVDVSTGSEFYFDVDADGYGDDARTVMACAVPEGYAAFGGDCDDNDAAINPETEWYADADADGYGTPNYVVVGCEQPAGAVGNDADCDDLNPDVKPPAFEVCDGVDNDCDGLTDDDDSSVEASTFSWWYPDDDEDGYGDETASPHKSCEAPSGYVADNTDCDDDEDQANPGHAEECSNGIDNDCDGGPNFCEILGEDTMTDAMAEVSDSPADYLGQDLDLGDVDDDGANDLIISAYYSTDDGGHAYLVTGPITGSVTVDTDADADFYTSTASDFVGRALSVGDMDDDGIDDFALGAYGDDSGGSAAGKVYLVYGRSAGFSGGYNLSTVADAAWEGGASSDYLGTSVAFVGDMDGDDTSELAMGAYGADAGGSSSGSVYLVYGSSSAASGTSDAADADAIISGDNATDYLGYYGGIGGGADIDGDGYADMLLGAYGEDTGASTAGSVYVFLGGTTLSGSLGASDGDAQYTGTSASDFFGQAVGGAGDVDDDGYDDFLVGAPAADPGTASEGIAYLFLGTSTISGTTPAAKAAATFSGTVAYDYVGSEVDAADVDDDGNSDVVIGAYGYDPSSVSGAGAVFVFNGPLSGAYDTSDADASLYGVAVSGAVGRAVTTGDLTDDGYDDLAIGAPGIGSAFVFGGGGL